MKKIFLQRIGKLVIWTAGFLLLYWAVTGILLPKYYFNTSGTSPETENWNAFYAEPKDSLDVLFIGSSHVYLGINPVDFYEESGGVTSFALTSSRQDFLTSYFYLKEALRYQSPRYVVLDMYGTIYPALTDLVSYKRSLDYMRWSPVKAEAVRLWTQANSESETFASRLFPLIDYHSRWEELSDIDFDSTDYTSTVNGYVPAFTTTELDFSGYTIPADTTPFQLDETNLSYFYKIADLCKTEGIELILVHVPYCNSSPAVGLAIRQLAETSGLLLLDYNDSEHYQRTGLSSASDFRDAGHLNHLGSAKLTSALAEDLTSASVTPQPHPAEITDLWAEKAAAWQSQYAVSLLQNTTDFIQYLTLLDNEDYVVFCASQGQFVSGLTEEALDKLEHLGIPLPGDLDDSSAWTVVCCNGDKLAGKRSADPAVIRISTKVDGQSTRTIAAAAGTGAVSSIIIDDVEYSPQKNGLNFVVYSLDRREVIDTVNYDLRKTQTAAR